MQHPARFVAGSLGFVALLVVLGVLSTHRATWGLAGAGVVLAAGLAAVDLRLFPVLAVPCTLLVARVGSTGSGLSISDLVLLGALLCAIPLVTMREAPELRGLLWVVVVYELLILPTVLDNPYRADIIEWVHEAALVGGSLVIGWVVGRGERARIALGLYLIGVCVIALWAGAWVVTHHLQPANLPLGMQKNFLGDQLAFATVIAFARPAWIGWTARWTRVAIAICLLGIVASQSKQAMISVALGVAIVALRGRSSNLARRSKGLLFLMVPLVVVAYVTVQREFTSANKFNSVHQRLTWYSQSVQVWHASEWVGVGLRWWYTDRFPFAFQPPNAEAEMLTSAGILGIVAILYLFGASLTRLWRLPAAYGTLAFTVVAMRILQGQFDIFWVAAQGSLPWMVAGIAMGAMALDRARSRSRDDEPPGPALPAPEGARPAPIPVPQA